jgi:hypothetical protein
MYGISCSSVCCFQLYIYYNCTVYGYAVLYDFNTIYSIYYTTALFVGDFQTRCPFFRILEEFTFVNPYFYFYFYLFFYFYYW